jgi:16S rRNA G966 N2-methylase RsmD
MDNLSRAGASVIGGGGQQVRQLNGSSLVYEDPALALNLNDDQWNDIVQKNYAAFEKEKVVAIENKKKKNMVVYDHQQEQIKQRQMRESFEKKKDKEHF